MNDSNRVHEEWGATLVKSNHGPNIFYRVFYGTVNWDRSPDGMVPAVTVLMQYGNTKDWSKAKSKGEIEFGMPAHILCEDLAGVVEAIQSLAGRHGLKA